MTSNLNINIESPSTDTVPAPEIMELNLSPSSVPGRMDDDLFTKIIKEKARILLLDLTSEIVDEFECEYLEAVKTQIKKKISAFPSGIFEMDRLKDTLKFEVEVDLTNDVLVYFNPEQIAEYRAVNQDIYDQALAARGSTTTGVAPFVEFEEAVDALIPEVAQEVSSAMSYTRTTTGVAPFVAAEEAVAVPIPEVAQEAVGSAISYTNEELKIRKQFKKMKFAPAKILDSHWQPNPDSKRSKAKVRVFSVKWKSTKLSKAEYDVLVKMKAEEIGDFKDAILTELDGNRYRLDWKDSDAFESYFERNDKIVKKYLAKCRKERERKSSRFDVSRMLRKN